MKVHYYLCRPNQEGQMSIILFANVRKKRFRYNTELKVFPSEWDDKRQRVKAKSRALLLNEMLDTCATYAAEYADKALLRKNVSQVEFKQYLDVRLGKVEPVDDSFFGFLTRFCKNAGKRTNGNGEFVKPKTVQKYFLLLNALKEFERYKRKTVRNYRITFDNFSMPIVDQFKVFLADEKCMSVNTIGRYLQNLRMIFGLAVQEGYEVGFDWKSIKAKKEKVENIVLTEEELDRLADLDVSDNERLRNVRDMFLISAYSGFRHSDANNLTPNNINREKGLIRIHQIKTGGLVEVPLHKNLLRVLDDRNFTLPHPVSSTNYNKYIKECCFLAGLDEKVEIKKVVGGKRLLKTYEKWQLVTSHTARRSFATNLYLRGMNEELIMSFTGHVSRSSFYKYICLSPAQKAQMLKDVWDMDK